MYQPKRQSAAMLALVFFVLSVFPVKRSEALGPLAVLAVAAYDAAGTVVIADVLTSGVSALIGGSIVALAITPSTADAPMRVPLVSDQPTIDAVMPPPAAPATAAKVTKFDWYNNYYYSDCVAAIASNFPRSAGATWQEACSAIGGTASGGGCTKSVAPVSQCNMAETATFLASAVEDCPAGYTESGSSCALVNARAAQPDQKYDVPAAAGGGSGYVAPSSLQEGDAKPAYAAFSGGKVYASGKDSSGRPVQIEYAVSADGTKKYITHYTQMEDATQTTVRTQSITVDSVTGAVTSATTGTAVGSVAPATSVGGVGTVTQGAAVTSGAGSSSSPIVFPSDYARAGEAASAVNTVKTSVDQLKDKFTNSETVDDPTVPDWADHWGATFNPLKAWTMPGHSSQCPVAGFGWNGVTYTIDSHCQLITDHWSALQTASVVVWVISALWILLGA